MSILDRIAALFQAKTNTLLNALEDPNETLDLSYEKMLTGLQDTKRHLADVVAQQKSLERQIATVDQEIAGAEGDAATAVQANRDDLARAALVHRRRAMDTRAGLAAAHDAILPEVEKLTAYMQQLSDKIDRFRTQKETMKASYTAAQAQVKVAQALTGTSSQIGGVGAAYQRAEDKMLAMRDKASAMDGLIESGILNDPLDKRDSSARQIAALRDGQAIEDELAQMKVKLIEGAAPDRRGLPSPDSEKKET